MQPHRIVVLAPGHFHAALIQKEALPGIDPRVHVYAPLNADLLAHLGRIAGFNDRPVNPTAWALEVHAGDDWRQRFLRDRPGNVVVLAGRNRAKLDLMELAVDAGMHVLADKPWIIEPENLPRLAALLQRAAAANLLVYDVMTERYEITSILQRDIVNDPVVFGAIEPSDAANPAVAMESVHYLKKQVAGAPLRRPAWFFDIAEQGEALADVGTHLVDQVLWMLFTEAPIDSPGDIRIAQASRWPTVLDAEQFAAITGLAAFPPALSPSLNGGRLECFCNNRVVYKLRDVFVRHDVLWDYEAPPGGDTHNAVFRGSRSSAIIRQAGGKLPELFVAPKAGERNAVSEALFQRAAKWQSHYPGVDIANEGDEFRVLIPDKFRTTHEAHFAEVAAQFLKRLAAPISLPSWETSNLLAKYFVTTQGVASARRSGAG
jgi:predicted dehydrogenase